MQGLSKAFIRYVDICFCLKVMLDFVRYVFPKKNLVAFPKFAVLNSRVYWPNSDLHIPSVPVTDDSGIITSLLVWSFTLSRSELWVSGYSGNVGFIIQIRLPVDFSQCQIVKGRKLGIFVLEQLY